MWASANAQTTTDSPALPPTMMMNLTRSVPATLHPPPPIPDFPAHPLLLSVRCAAHMLKVVSPMKRLAKAHPLQAASLCHASPGMCRRGFPPCRSASTLHLPCSAPSANSKCVPADPPQVPGHQAGTPPHHPATSFAAAASSMPFASRAPILCPRWTGARAAKRLAAGGRAPRHPAALAPAAAATPSLVQDNSPQVGSGTRAARRLVRRRAGAASSRGSRSSRCCRMRHFPSSGGIGARAAQRLVAGGRLLQRRGVLHGACPYHPLPKLCILLAQLVHLWRQATKL